MRWILVILLMCNGIYFLWQNYLLQNAEVQMASELNSRFLKGSNQLILLSELTRTEEVAVPVTIAVVDIDMQNELLAGLSEKAQKPTTSEELTLPEDSKIEKSSNTCWLIGPFKEEISGKQVVNRLKALDITIDMLSIAQAGKPDYWVYIPPQASRKVAIRLLRELQSRKIDSYLITNGELSKGLSLGFFTEKSRAQAVYDKRVEQGYDAKIKIVPRSYNESWGVFDTRKYGKFTDILWDKIQEGNKGLERRKNYCDRIASSDNLD